MQVSDITYGDPRYYMTGIVSFGPEDCGFGMGVYTRMTAHMNYILDRLE